MEKFTSPEGPANQSNQDHYNAAPRLQPTTTQDMSTRIQQALVCRMSPAGRRVFSFLATYGKATTGHIARVCEVGNVSDAVIKIQPVLLRNGLMIRNYLPPEKRVNRFAGRNESHDWELVPAPVDGGVL